MEVCAAGRETTAQNLEVTVLYCAVIKMSPNEQKLAGGVARKYLS
jgi:hypothetical protein